MTSAPHGPSLAAPRFLAHPYRSATSMTRPTTITADYSLRPNSLAEALAMLIRARQLVIVWGPLGTARHPGDRRRPPPRGGGRLLLCRPWLRRALGHANVQSSEGLPRRRGRQAQHEQICRCGPPSPGHDVEPDPAGGASSSPSPSGSAATSSSPRSPRT